MRVGDVDFPRRCHVLAEGCPVGAEACGGRGFPTALPWAGGRVPRWGGGVCGAWISHGDAMGWRKGAPLGRRRVWGVDFPRRCHGLAEGCPVGADACGGAWISHGVAMGWQKAAPFASGVTFCARRRCIFIASPRQRRGETVPNKIRSPVRASQIAPFKTRGAPRHTQRHAVAETRDIRPQMSSCGDVPSAALCIAAPQQCWTPKQRKPHNRSANRIVQTRFLEF
jgi:hypothetical protein